MSYRRKTKQHSHIFPRVAYVGAAAQHNATTVCDALASVERAQTREKSVIRSNAEVPVHGTFQLNFIEFATGARQ